MDTYEEEQATKDDVQKSKDTQVEIIKGRQGKALPIQSLRSQEQNIRIIKQTRQAIVDNTAANEGQLQQREATSRSRQQSAQTLNFDQREEQSRVEYQQPEAQAAQMAEQYVNVQPPGRPDQSDTVQVKVGGF
ncbi:MAG: hypothetical protein GWN41_06705, partial [Phycisphaerae bacterium]|nr:hypothetical protein [Phycisphaerae bacterium]